MAASLTEVDPGIDMSTGLVYSLARSRSQREGAFRLVYDSYLRSGLGAPNPFEMRVTPYQLHEATQIFVGQLQELVVSTVTLVPDCEEGLPMESIYPLEIEALRAQGVRLAEVSCLADRRKDPRRFLPAFCQLTRVMAQYARRQGIDELLVAVHPRHARFYSRYLGFQQIGGLAACDYVQGRPAVALSFNFDRFDRERPPCYSTFFGEQIPVSELEPYHVPAEERVFSATIASACYLQPADNGLSTSAAS